MSEKPVRSGQPTDRSGGGPDLTDQRDAFLNNFFRRGAELTKELVRENELYRDRIALLERDNASLKTAVANDHAIHDLIATVERLESEKARLLSAVHEQETLSGRFHERFSEVESDLESLANLHVATHQIHASLRVPVVMKNIMDLLVQLVGAASLGVYFATEDRRQLVPIASTGVDLPRLPAVVLATDVAGATTDAILERTFLTGLAYVAEGLVEAPPAACVPLRLEQTVVGAIAVFTLLPQKPTLLQVDRDLFDLLDAHAAAALVAAYAVATGTGRTPSPESLRELCS
ncbi:MAG: GAF domain-containing protein [Polyangiaceae bacterium]|jgi:GAF domain-containing protein